MTVKIKDYTQNKDLAEIYQKSTSVFAFAKLIDVDTYQQCCQFVKCRDFLNDVVRAQLTNKPIGVYGFKFVPGDDPSIDLENTIFIIKDPNKDLEPALKKATMILNYYETLMNVSSSTSYITVDEHTGIVRGPKEWLQSSTLTSLYTLMFRVGEQAFEIDDIKNLTAIYKQHIESIGSNITGQDYRDLNYLKSIYENLEFFLKNYKIVLGITDKEPFDKTITANMSIGTYHNYSGIVTFLGESNSYVDNKRKPFFKELLKKGEIAPVKTEEPTATKILTVLSDKPSHTYTGYEPNYIKFAFVTTDGGRRVLCHDPVSCREHLISAFRALYSEDSDADLITQKKIENKKTVVHLVDKEKLRLLATVPGVGMVEDRMQYHKREMFFAKKILNYYEKLVGFKPTVISTVQLKDSVDKSDYAWLFTGSAEWQLSPVLLSLYPLIIRCAKRYVYHIINNSENAKLPTKLDAKAITAIWEILKSAKDITTPDKLMYTNHDEILKLLKYAKELFTAPPIEAFFIKNEFAMKKNETINGHFYVNYLGINTFISGKQNYVNKNLAASVKAFLENQK